MFAIGLVLFVATYFFDLASGRKIGEPIKSTVTALVLLLGVLLIILSVIVKLWQVMP